MQSEDSKATEIWICIAAICFCLFSVCYTLRKLFKCYLYCRKGPSANETVFKAGFRGDSSTSSTPQSSPDRNEYDPLTPPVHDVADMV